MWLELRDAVRRFGARRALDGVSFGLREGEIGCLLGPSGCGKTTLLRSIAGLEHIDSGTITVGGAVVSDAGTFVAPERRGVGMVFQDWALFPHLSVARNVGYGVPDRAARAQRVHEALERVGLEELGDRMPGTLSGGQKQRVAVARALAPEPSVLLLDEPFSNLDTALRVELRAEVHRLLRELEITAIFVTHDQEEAFAIGDEVAVMLDGDLIQQAAPAELYANPATPWVASFVGDANLVVGTASDAGVTTPVGTISLRVPLHGQVQVLIRPEDLAVDAGDAAVVEEVAFYGHDTVYAVRHDGGPYLRVRAGAAPQHRPGDRVDVTYRGGPTVAWPAA